MNIQLRYKTCVWSQTIQISNNSISPPVIFVSYVTETIICTDSNPGEPKKAPSPGILWSIRRHNLCVIFFSSIRGSVLNHFNFNCVLEGSVLTKTLLPFCVFSSTVDTTTRVKRGDLFSYSLKTSSKGGATSSKPWELYGDLIELYGAEGGWVLDFCSGSGELFGIFFPVNIFFSKFTFQHPRPISFYYKSFVTIAAKNPNNLVTRFYCQ